MTVAGVDVGRLRDPSAIVRLAGNGAIVGAHRVRLGETWRANVSTILQLVRGCELVAVDATGVGSPICEALTEHGVPVLPVTFTAATKLSLMQDLGQALRQLRMDPNAPGAADLGKELHCFTASPTRKGVKLTGKQGGTDDLVTALALAVRAFRVIACRSS